MATDYLTVPHLDRATLDRIFSRIEIDPVTDCWIWTGGKSSEGYGRIRYYKKGYRQKEYLHRIMYAWLIGPVPRGLGHGIPVLDHVVCDNRACCNPFHLQLTSIRTNVLRGNGKTAKQARQVLCIHGHALDGLRGDGRRYCKECDRRYHRKKSRRDRSIKT